MLWPLSRSSPTALPASGADALPRTTEFMSSDSALSMPVAPLTIDERGRAFGGPAAALAIWSPLRAGNASGTAAELLRRAVPAANVHTCSLGPGVLAGRQRRLPARGFPLGGCSSSRRSRTSCWSTARRPFLLPNVRAEAPGADGWLARLTDDSQPPSAGQGSRPWRVASRARG